MLKSGIDPEKELKERSRVSRDLRLEMDGGIWPEKELDLRTRV